MKTLESQMSIDDDMCVNMFRLNNGFRFEAKEQTLNIKRVKQLPILAKLGLVKIPLDYNTERIVTNIFREPIKRYQRIHVVTFIGDMYDYTLTTSLNPLKGEIKFSSNLFDYEIFSTLFDLESLYNDVTTCLYDTQIENSNQLIPSYIAFNFFDQYVHNVAIPSMHTTDFNK